MLEEKIKVVMRRAEGTIKKWGFSEVDSYINSGNLFFYK